MTGTLQGKVALITGGGSGVGEACARLFAEDGASVAVMGRRPEPLQRVAAEIDGLAVPGDASTRETARGPSRRPLAAFGRLDVLVSCAGIMQEGSVTAMRPGSGVRSGREPGCHHAGRACGHPAHAPRYRQQHRQRELAGGPGGPRRHGRVCHQQVGRRGAHPVDGGRLRPSGHPRQHAGARLDTHPDEQRNNARDRERQRHHARRGPRARHPLSPPRAHGGAPSRSPAAPASWPQTTRRSSPARCWSPTAAATPWTSATSRWRRRRPAHTVPVDRATPHKLHRARQRVASPPSLLYSPPTMSSAHAITVRHQRPRHRGRQALRRPPSPRSTSARPDGGRLRLL